MSKTTQEPDDPRSGGRDENQNSDSVHHAEVDHSIRKHAACSPSTLKSREICPGWVNQESKVVHEITESGTRCHEALETGDYSGLDEEELRLTEMCAGFRDGYLLLGGPYESIKDPKLETHEPDTWGYADEICLGDKSAHIFDWKFGFGEIEDPEVNPQAWAYARGAFLKWNWIEKITFHFVVPRQEFILQHTFTRADIPRLKLRISTINERVKAKDKDYNPVESNCLYCGFKAQCPALAQRYLPLAQKYQPEELPAVPNPADIIEPETMAKALVLVPLLEKWCAEVKQFALAMRMEDGEELPGYELKSRRGKTYVINPNLASKIAEENGITHEEFIEACSVSSAQLGKVIYGKAEKGKAKARDAFTQKLIDEGAASEPQEVFYLKKYKQPKQLTA